MKKLLLIFAALSSFALGQQDIPVPGVGPYKTLARNWTWAGTGPGAFNNTYIFTPVPNYGNACFSVRNDDTVTHTFALTVFGTTDQATSTFNGNTAGWASILPIGNNQFSVLGNGGVTTFSLLTGGYFRLAITLSGGAGAGTVTVTSVETQGSNICQFQSAGTTAPFLGASGPVHCNGFAQAQIAAAGTTSILPPATNESIYVCGFILNVDAALTGNGFTIVTGTGATCGTGTQTLVGPIFLPTTVGSSFVWAQNTGIIGSSGINGRLCVTSGATVGTIRASVMVAQF